MIFWSERNSIGLEVQDAFHIEYDRSIGRSFMGTERRIRRNNYNKCVDAFYLNRAVRNDELWMIDLRNYDLVGDVGVDVNHPSFDDDALVSLFLFVTNRLPVYLDGFIVKSRFYFTPDMNVLSFYDEFAKNHFPLPQLRAKLEKCVEEHKRL
jgi:hypothetical protein